MKMKLLLFMGLLAGSIGFSLLGSTTTYAVGESYKWIDANTIEGSGGSFTQTTGIVKDGPSGSSRPVPVQTVRFTRDGTTKTFKAPTTGIYYGSAGGGTGSFSTKCDLQLSITVSALNGGSIATNEPGKTSCTNTGLTQAVTIADTDKGPTAESLGVGTTVTTGPGAPIGATTDSEEPDSTGCNIEAIGWIICPVVRFMAKIVDGAYAFVSSLLEIQPLTATNGPANESIYGAWSVMQGFANVAFVIAFMFIIYSQLTSFGLNNYGVKKMLPRLIVAAILVNVSFWICALAVDISNILGASLNGLFKSIPVAGSETASFQVNDPSVTGTGWQGLVGGIVASTVLIGAVLYVTLSALVPAILAAFIAIITVFLVLSIRQALVILLIVVSPLAFVAYLLPNTESLYKKWLGLFKTMLLMYPVIALLFGASALASKIVMNSATGTYALAIQIMGALISIVPLALTPIVMKTAGNLLGRIGAVVNNPNKGPIDGLRKRADAFKSRRQAIAGGRRMDRGAWALDKVGGVQNKIRGDGKSWIRRRAASTLGTTASSIASSGATVSYNNEQRNENAKRGLTEAQQDYVANRAADDLTYAQSIAGPTGNAAKLQSAALTAVQNRKLQEIKDEHAFVDTMSGAQLKSIILDPPKGTTDTKISAAIESYIKQASTDEVEQIVNKYATNGDTASIVNQTLSKTLAQDGPGFLKGSDFTTIARGQMGKDGNAATLTELAKNNIKAGVYAQEKLVAAPADELRYSLRVANEAAAEGDAAAREMLRIRATELRDNETLKGKIKHNEDAINDIIGSAPSPRPQNPPTVQNQPQAPQPQPQQPGVLNIPHNANPGNARMSPPPNSGSATILNPNNRNNNNP